MLLMAMPIARNMQAHAAVIRSGVTIEEGVTIEDSIILDNVVVKKGCSLKRVIVDKLNIIPEGERLGFEPDKDRFKCHIDSSGIALLPKGGKASRRRA